MTMQTCSRTLKVKVKIMHTVTTVEMELNEVGYEETEVTLDDKT